MTHRMRLKKKLKLHWQPRWLTRDGGNHRSYWLWEHKPILEGNIWTFVSGRGSKSLGKYLPDGCSIPLQPDGIKRLY